ncbi:MAG: iron ABC transporter permease [Roseburia sp.]|nr:iron ABC transporter permease [Roseburia sp.]MCM1097849.1 iron ABC transporter permease [Ruminococcus flavefaciens]
MRQAHRRFLITMIVLTVLLAWGIVLNINLGSVHIPPDEIFRMIWDAARYRVLNLFTGGAYAERLEAVTGASTQSKILFGIRMPRMLLAAVLGGALAVSGFLLQTFFRNPIAGPFVLGISSGAKLIVGILFVFSGRYIWKVSSAALVLSAFVGSLLVVSVVLLFSQRVRNMSMLLVVGIMIGYICSAATDFCIAFAKEHDIANLTSWSMGSFSGANWGNVAFSAGVCLPGLLLAWLFSKPIGVYALGEGYAQSLGVNVRLFRAGLILLSSLLSACVTAFAGPISFVGIAVPHITRTMLKTSRPAAVIPVTYLSGAVFCIYCDLIARTLFSPTELAIGTVTAAFGAPVVIVMMLKRRSAES